MKSTAKKEVKKPVKRVKRVKGGDYINGAVTLLGVSAALLVFENFLEERSRKKKEALYSQKIFDFDELEMESMDLQTPKLSPKVPVKPAKVPRRTSSSVYVTAKSSPS